VSSSTRLKLITVAKGELGWEYAQSNPEETIGAEYGRRRTIDCSGFVRLVYSRAGTGISLGSTVTSQYIYSILHPDRLRVMKGPRCTQVGSETVKRGSETVPVIEEIVGNEGLTGDILAGDIGIRGMKKAPYRGPDGGVVSDFSHVVVFTGRSLNGQLEYIHAPDQGEGVDIDRGLLSRFNVVLRLVSRP
jgi:hypothetical protein